MAWNGLGARVRNFVLAIFSLASAGGMALAQKTETVTITVFAAASLKTALDEVSAVFTASSGHQLKISYASSSALAKQIEQSAPADVFISADLEWMDYLAGKGYLAGGTRSTLLGNALVLIAPASSDVQLEIGQGFALAGALGEGRLAIGDVRSVPAGKYAKSALEALGVWSSVEGKLAPADNVRAALAFVAQAEAPLGIVYKTDANAEPKVKIIGTFPEGTHAPIVYPAAMTKSAAAPDAAKALLAFLKTAPARAIFTRHGFTQAP